MNERFYLLKTQLLDIELVGHLKMACLVEDTEPYPNSFSKQKHIRKPCLSNTLPHIKTLQPAGL